MTEIEIGPQESLVDRKLLVLVAVVLALLLVGMCYVGYLLIRSLRQAEAQAVQPVVIPPTLAPSVQTTETFLPVVVDNEVPAPAVAIAPTPAVAAVSTSPVWRFLSIDKDDIGTFENVGNPNQRLVAKCIDIKRPSPGKGELYILEESGILKAEDGSKRFQRFEVIPGK